jgi:ribonuclease BN (tRNA processing enzyme)
MSDGFFPVKFEDLVVHIKHKNEIKDRAIEIDGVIIDHITLQHPQGGFGYRFREDDKTLVFITDNELTTDDSWSGRSPEDYIRFSSGADVLIHDCQYTPEERETRKGWGHSDYASVLDLAFKAEVKKLLLFHHEPSRTDADMDVIKALCQDIVKEKNPEMELDVAREDMAFTL